MRGIVLFLAVASIAVACGGATASDCPGQSQLGRGVACTTGGLTCPYTLTTLGCGGTSSTSASSCTCANGLWDCPEVGPPQCPADGGTCVNGATKPAGDGCNTCTCMNGQWGCTLMACPAPSDPGKITCAGAPCDVPANYCCDGAAADGGTQKCVPLSVSSCGDLRRACDEAADCNGGQVCCIPPNNAPFVAYNAQCAPTCKNDPLSYQLCKTDAECENGLTCVTQLCHGKEIRSCGPLPASRCQ
jgi:hypothetical protein